MARSNRKRQTFFFSTYPIKRFMPNSLLLSASSLHDKNSSRDASEHVLDGNQKTALISQIERSLSLRQWITKDIPEGFGGSAFHGMAWLYVSWRYSLRHLLSSLLETLMRDRWECRKSLRLGLKKNGLTEKHWLSTWAIMVLASVSMDCIDKRHAMKNRWRCLF